MIDAMDALKELVRRASMRRLARYTPYPWQKAFHDGGAHEIERILLAANRVGKTLCAAAEVAMHATGQYPDWWTGKRFRHHVLIWCGAITNESNRDIVQKELLGGVTSEKLGTGMIPGETIIGKPRMRQAGVGDVVDSVRVRHADGKTSEIIFKTYDQGWTKWQGAAPEIVWLDEEPEDFMIYTESLTRVLTRRGIVMVTFTPLRGVTSIVDHFQRKRGPRVGFYTATWDDAPHLSVEDREHILSSYPDYEREARSRGVPMMGEGRVFTTPEDDIVVAPRSIPPHWARIKGVDFGVDHPASVVDIAWDRDKDVIYITRDWRRRDADVVEHAAAITHDTPWVPVSWPHDGTTREKSNGRRLKDHYTEKDVKMLAMSARYDNKVGGPQPVEPIVVEIQKRAMEGRLKVFATCTAFLEEYRSAHRRNGKVVAIHDDVLKAAMYAIMMRRYAMPELLATRGRHQVQGSFTKAIV